MLRKVSNNVIVTATPKIFPRFRESARIPDAIPSSDFSTLVIIALLEGDWNSPFPIPIIPDAKIICHIWVEVSKVVKIKSAII